MSYIIHRWLADGSDGVEGTQHTVLTMCAKKNPKLNPYTKRSRRSSNCLEHSDAVEHRPANAETTAFHHGGRKKELIGSIATSPGMRTFCAIQVCRVNTQRFNRKPYLSPQTRNSTGRPSYRRPPSAASSRIGQIITTRRCHVWTKVVSLTSWYVTGMSRDVTRHDVVS